MWECEEACPQNKGHICCYYCEERNCCEDECGLDPTTCHSFVNDDEE